MISCNGMTWHPLLWIELVSHVEAWLALDSGFTHPDEERLPPAWCHDLPPAPQSPPPASELVAFPALGRWGPARWTLRNIAGSQTPPVVLSQQLSPAAPAFFHAALGLSLAATVTFLYEQLSLLHILSLLYILTRCASAFRLWMRLHGWRFPPSL